MPGWRLFFRRKRQKKEKVVHYLQYGHTWKPLRRAHRRQMRVMATTQHQRGEVILRNLAQELLTSHECNDFKQALQHFRISKSVPTLCTQLKPVINTTEKLMLLLELSGKLPVQLQRDFHKLCSLQFSSYESFLKYFNTGSALSNDPKIIAKDSSGQFQVVSTGFEKTIHVIPNEETNGTDGISLPGTSVTSGVYSETDDQSPERSVNKVEKELIFNHSYRGPPKMNGHSRSQSQERSKTPSRVSMKSLTDYPHHATHSRKSSSHSTHHLRLHSSTSNGPYSPRQEVKDVNPTRRRVLLKRRDDGSLGVGIKGGKEYGTPILVYLVEANSQAEQQGLKVGDQIMEVNGTEFSQLTHAEAVTLMQNAWNLIIEVETPTPHTAGKPVSVKQLSNNSSRDVIIYPNNGGKLGCAVNRDPVTGDIIVKDVETNSPAEKAGLNKGDCILKIDGLSVNILSEKQIAGLTNSKRVKLIVKRVLPGKENKPTSRPRIETVASDDVFAPIDLPSPRSPDAFFTSSTPRYQEGDPNHHKMANGSVRHDHHGFFLTQKQDHDRNHVPTVYRKYNRNNTYVPRHSTNQKMTMVYQPKHSGTYNERSRSVTRVKAPIPQLVRSRSQSPHSLRTAPSMTTEDRVVLHAVQASLQKRQRALRLSLYQVPDGLDEEWKI